MKNEMITFILEAQEAQLANPTRACVNSESAFVADRLRSMGHKELAKTYWSWVCSFRSTDSLKFGWKVYDNELKLKQIDAGFTMPEWGYKGT
jgi:hypothetical protein